MCNVQCSMSNIQCTGCLCMCIVSLAALMNKVDTGHRSSNATLVRWQRRVFFKMTQTDEKRPLNKWSGSFLQVADRFSSLPIHRWEIYILCAARGDAKRVDCVLLDSIRGTGTQVKSMEWSAECPVVDSLPSVASLLLVACRDRPRVSQRFFREDCI